MNKVKQYTLIYLFLMTTPILCPIKSTENLVKSNDSKAESTTNTLEQKLTKLTLAEKSGNLEKISHAQQELSDYYNNAMSFFEHTKDLFSQSNVGKKRRKIAQIRKENYTEQLVKNQSEQTTAQEALKEQPRSKKYNRILAKLKTKEEKLNQLIYQEQIALGEKWSSSRKALYATLTIAAAAIGLVYADKYLETGYMENILPYYFFDPTTKIIGITDEQRKKIQDYISDIKKNNAIDNAYEKITSRFTGFKERNHTMQDKLQTLADFAMKNIVYDEETKALWVTFPWSDVMKRLE